ncbi:MAG TPA: pseudouridine synthase [Polyangiaceae bacterium]|nr:pseudouridine synthase [Polyangiaceae bacterium]
MRERLQKIIARAGITSRRAAEELIVKGRVRVNGKVVTELGAQADPFEDKVELDDKRLMPEALVYVVLHKPRDVVSTLSDPEGRPTVKEMLTTAGGRVYPVGRLDFATSGVLLATNDGEFAHALLHPKKDVPKTYVLKVRGNMDEDALERWRTGVDLEDGRTLPAKARLIRHEGEKTWIEVTLREGRNQQIRRMGDATGFPVMRLARTSFAGITSDGLRPGEWRPLSSGELNALREAYGVPKRIPKSVPKRSSRAPVTRGMSPRPGYEDRARERERDARAGAEGKPAADARDARPTRDAQPSRDARPSRDDQPRSARSGRSGTTPRGAAGPAPRARGPADRSRSRGRP